MEYVYKIWNGITSIGAFLDLHNGAVTAVATAFIGIYTAVLAKISGRQTTLARQEFISTHRPKVRIKHVRLQNGWKDRQPLSVELVIVNTGDTKAVVDTVRIAFCTTNNLNILPDRVLEESPFVMRTNDSVISGLTIVYKDLSDGMVLDASDIVQMSRKNIYLICIGDVGYTDEVGTPRKTAFYRYWDETKFRAQTPYPDPDYEYQD